MIPYLSKRHDDKAVSQGLGPQQPKVSLIMDGTKGIIDTGSHNGKHTGEGGVQDGHPQAIAHLHAEVVISWISILNATSVFCPVSYLSLAARGGWR